MKKQLLNNSTRNIKRSFPRFLSLLIMSLLGVFAFSGLQATAPDMINSLDKYLDDHLTYDIKITSSLGLSDEDIIELKKIEGIEEIYGSYNKDVLVEINNEDFVIALSSISTNMNTLRLIDGNLPTNKEIVVEENMLKKSPLKIGDALTIEGETYTISGTVDSSLYFNYCGVSQSRGTSSIGSGVINYYAFLDASNFDVSYYSYIYITVSNALKQTTSSKKYNKLVDNVLDKINDCKSTLENNRYAYIYNETQSKIDEANKKLNDAKKILDKTKEDLDTALNTINTNVAALDSALLKKGFTRASIDPALETLPATRDSYPVGSEHYIAYQELYDAFIEFKANYALLDEQKKVYDENYNKYLLALNEYNLNKEQVDLEINDAKAYLDNLEKPTYYINDRLNYSTYAEFVDDTNSIKNLSLIFPIVFFSVAVLISLISMNRLVEYDRTEIGTLKSLGFSNYQIMFKYLLFSSIATILGGIIGSVLGIIIIPKLIFSIYSILFTLPKFILGLNIQTTILGFIISFACVCGSTLFTVLKVLREKPSELMRPKSPKPGKRILLEKVKALWSRLNFSKKITIRNLFRYKKRAIITIIGITGCTALMLCGFGIKDSIVDIPTHQYGQVFKFDGMSYVNGNIDVDSIFNDKITSKASVENVYASVDDYDVNIFISKNNDELSNIVNLEENILEENKVIITNKLANLLNVKTGDILNVKDSNNNLYEFEISAIIHNYIDHYLFISQKTWENNKQTFKANVVYFNTVDLSEQEKNALISDLLKNDEIISVSFISSLIERASNMLKSLDKVVIILIVLASLLSFVVLYNLSNININERKRELATLKVLGFYPNEVDGYITRENIILTLVGIVFGLIVGFFLTNIVISTVEIEKAKFIRYIKPLSYLYSTVITICFTLIVNFFTHFTLKKIDMIESLKSVE